MSLLCVRVQMYVREKRPLFKDYYNLILAQIADINICSFESIIYIQSVRQMIDCRFNFIVKFQIQI